MNPSHVYTPCIFMPTVYLKTKQIFFQKPGILVDQFVWL